MEDTLRAIIIAVKYTRVHVLILVLMEDTLRDYTLEYFNKVLGLNPCFNGRYSQRAQGGFELIETTVLILVLMEDTLRGE